MKIMNEAHIHVAIVAEMEGGYADIKGDRGGKTYYGIASQFIPGKGKGKYAELYNDIVNGKAPRLELVFDYYIERYWKNKNVQSQPYSLNKLLMYNYQVWGWSAGNVLALQFPLIALGANIEADGLMGPKTRSALAKVNVEKHLDKFISPRVIGNAVYVSTVIIGNSSPALIKNNAIAERFAKQASMFKNYRSIVKELIGSEYKPGCLKKYIAHDNHIPGYKSELVSNVNRYLDLYQPPRQRNNVTAGRLAYAKTKDIGFAQALNSNRVSTGSAPTMVANVNFDDIIKNLKKMTAENRGGEITVSANDMSLVLAKLAERRV